MLVEPDNGRPFRPPRGAFERPQSAKAAGRIARERRDES
jgi:hypothetical protein